MKNESFDFQPHNSEYINEHMPVYIPEHRPSYRQPKKKSFVKISRV